jgi:SAM-dependent methyltransferase
MPVDAQDLSSFYDEAIGQVARRSIGRRLRLAWPDLRGQRLLGYGFATPYLRPLLGEAERVVALIPAEQDDIVAWPPRGPLVALGEEDALPFPDAFFDRVMMVHGLETAEATRPLMRQIWRVLAPQGRLLLVVPNRASLWAQVERSPFAHGRPFNRWQLDRLLRESMLVPERWDTALYFPPSRMRWLVRNGAGWERIGRKLWPQIAGVHIVDATKSLYALAPPAKLRAARRVLVPAGN